MTMFCIPVIPSENEHLIAWKASVNEGLENIQVHPPSTCSTACLHRDHNVGNHRHCLKDILMCSILQKTQEKLFWEKNEQLLVCIKNAE